MGKASSSKKVQRAARAAASSRGAGEKRERGFPMLVGLIILLGVGLVFAARSSRDPVVAPRTGDHWHSAYELYDCGELMPPILNETDPDGIHTHADGLIHIHPFNSNATGTDARLGVFFAASGLSVTESSIGSGEFETVDGTSGCGDDDSEVRIARWNVDGADGPELVTVYDSDFGEIRLLQEREAFTIAKVPVGEDPPPPSDASLAQLDTTTGTTNLTSDPEVPDLAVDPPAAGDPAPAEEDPAGDPAPAEEDPAGDPAPAADPVGTDAPTDGE